MLDLPCCMDFPSCVRAEKWKSESESCSVMSDFCPRNSSGQNTGVGSLSLLQKIFPTQELNQGLLHCRRILYQLSYQGSPVQTGLVSTLYLSFFICLSHWSGFSYCWAWALGQDGFSSCSIWAQELQFPGSRAWTAVCVVHGPSGSAACGSLLYRGSNLCLLHWPVDSSALSCQGSPPVFIVCRFFWMMAILSSFHFLFPDN